MTAALSIEGLRDVKGALSWGAGYLADRGLADPGMEAGALLSGLLGCSSPNLLLKRDDLLPETLIPLYQAMVRRRAQHEPVAYILGRKNFYGRDFFVDPHVLIPRPETELLVECVLEWMEQKSSPRILDLGTGSGCIGITLAAIMPSAEVLAVDISQAALAVAQKNSEIHDVNNVRFTQSDLFQALDAEKKGYFDMILSNPPYVSTQEIQSLAADLFYEPLIALEAGETGTEVIEKILRHCGMWEESPARGPPAGEETAVAAISEGRVLLA